MQSNQACPMTSIKIIPTLKVKKTSLPTSVMRNPVLITKSHRNLSSKYSIKPCAPRPRTNSLGAHLPAGVPRISTSRQKETLPWQNDQVPNAKRKRVEPSPDKNKTSTTITKSNIPTANSFEILEVNETPHPIV